MNKNAEKWVEALRSGRFSQTQGRLLLWDNAQSFCCLGVACELYREEVGSLDWLGTEKPHVFQILGEEGILPLVVMEWLGLNTPKGEFGIDTFNTLIWENDEGTSFEEIANIIESEPEGLFVEVSTDA